LALLNGAMRRSTTESALTEALLQQELAIDAMTRLLNALLDISKLESGAVEPEVADFTLAAIFAQMRSEFAQLTMQKGLELRIESCDDSVRSDPALVSQVLRNLLSNAIKYTSRGWVLLRCRHERERVLVEGWTAVIVDLLGLPLEVRSDPGKGSAFSVALPMAAGPARQVPAREAAAAASPAPAHPLRKILLIEDDPAVRPIRAVLISGDTSSAVQGAALDRQTRIASKPINADELLGLLEELAAAWPAAALSAPSRAACMNTNRRSRRHLAPPLDRRHGLRGRLQRLIARQPQYLAHRAPGRRRVIQHRAQNTGGVDDECRPCTAQRPSIGPLRGSFARDHAVAPGDLQ
jgi:hypothetical protein